MSTNKTFQDTKCIPNFFLLWSRTIRYHYYTTIMFIYCVICKRRMTKGKQKNNDWIKWIYKSIHHEIHAWFCVSELSFACLSVWVKKFFYDKSYKHTNTYTQWNVIITTSKFQVFLLNQSYPHQIMIQNKFDCDNLLLYNPYSKITPKLFSEKCPWKIFCKICEKQSHESIESKCKCIFIQNIQ